VFDRVAYNDVFVDQRRSDAVLARSRRLLTSRNIRWRLLCQTEYDRLRKKLRNVFAAVGESNRYNTCRRDICAVLHSVVLGAQTRQARHIAGMYATDDVLNSLLQWEFSTDITRTPPVRLC